MEFARFMAGPVGRGVLIAVGLAVGSTGGTVLAVVGVLPLLAGALNICVIAPLLKAPFRGRDALGGAR